MVFYMEDAMLKKARKFAAMVKKIKTDKIMVVDGRGQVQGHLTKNFDEWIGYYDEVIVWQDDFRVKKF